MTPQKLVDEYNKISGSLSDEWDDDFMYPCMEVAPGDKIRFSYSIWTGIELGVEERSRYISYEEANKEFEKLQRKIIC